MARCRPNPTHEGKGDQEDAKLIRHMGGRDNNYHLMSIAIMAGRPPVGRCAFDLARTVNFVARCDELPLDDFAVIGRGDNALLGLLAAVTDARIRHLVASEYVHSFVSQIVAAKVSSPEGLTTSGIRWQTATDAIETSATPLTAAR